MPTPLPYVVAGTSPAAVNAAKGRPRDQPTGLSVADFALVEPWLALDPPTVVLARRLTVDLLLSLFVPVVDPAPNWLRPASSGLVGVTAACADRARPLLRRHDGHLELSSGNRTGCAVAVTAAQADAEFDGALLVLDGDDERDPDVPCGSAAIVVVRPGGDLELARGGIQTAGRDPGAFLDQLRRG
jgi:tRNA A37 threonylcarbamoyladenosine synthetase subunit TsaC/SUA5/YrdC